MRFGALVDMEGNKTASWYYAKKVNEEVHKYTDVFLNSKLIKTLLFTPTSQSTQNSESALEITMPDYVGAVSSVSYSTKGVQVSHLKNEKDGESKDYIIIVNQDLENFQSVNLRFLQLYKVYELTPRNSSEETNPPTWMNMPLGINESRTILPGGYLIFRFEPRIPAK